VLSRSVSFGFFRKAHNRRERSEQAFGIQAGLGRLEAAECPRGPAKIAASLTYRAVRCNTAKLMARRAKLGLRLLARVAALMQVTAHTRASLMSIHSGRAGAAAAGPVRLLCLLFLAGVAMRLTLLAIPPVIPLVHEQLHMSETQIGLLVGLPLAVFAIAAVPGSLFIARVGSTTAVIFGITVAAVAGAARGAAVDVLTLYAASLAAGFGIAVMQPAMPTLAREWLPARIALATIAYSSGMVIGATLPPALTLVFVLPLAGGSWRLDLLFWALPTALIAFVFFLLNPRSARGADAGKAPAAARGSWWPDWKNPVVWLLGFAFGANSGPFFAANAFLGDYLASVGQPRLLGSALGALNGAQLVGLAVLIVMSGRLQQRIWPFLVFGPAMLAAFVGLMLAPSPHAIIICSAVIGISTSITMTAVLALPPLLAAPADVSRTAAGMLTITYTCAIVIPTLCGALWDFTGKSWTTFVLPCVCCLALTVTGIIAARYPAYTEKLSGQQA
jgi:MFS transporter, CP family, cyanate transporter